MYDLRNNTSSNYFRKTVTGKCSRVYIYNLICIFSMNEDIIAVPVLPLNISHVFMNVTVLLSLGCFVGCIMYFDFLNY